MPCSRRPTISASTWADSWTPRDAVGSSSASSSGRCRIARATATSWRWPPDRVRMLRVVSGSGICRLSSTCAAAAWNRLCESMRRRGSCPSRMLAATSRLSHSARSCQTTPIPWRPAAAGSAGTFRPARKISPPAGAMSPAMQRTSVVLPAPFSPASAMSSPGRTLRSTLSSARTAPNLTSSPDTVSSGAGASSTASGTRAVIEDPPQEGRSCQTLWDLTPLPGHSGARTCRAGYCTGPRRCTDSPSRGPGPATKERGL